MRPLVVRVAWAVVGALVAIDLGVLATWASRHPDGPRGGELGAGAMSHVLERPVDTTAVTATPAPATGSPAPVAPAGGATKATGAAPAKAVAGDAPRGTTANLDRGDLLFDLTVEPACATRGKPMSATARIVPGAYVSLIVAYSDGKSYGTMYAGPTLPDGSFVLRWTVPVEAAAGTGHVLAAAHDPATAKSGRNAVEFVVKDKGC